MERIRFRIKATLGTSVERVLEAVQKIKKAHPKAEISVEVEV